MRILVIVIDFINLCNILIRDMAIDKVSLFWITSLNYLKNIRNHTGAIMPLETPPPS